MPRPDCHLEMAMLDCSSLSTTPGKGAQELFTFLHATGGHILRVYPPPRAVWEDDPFSAGKVLRMIGCEEEEWQIHPNPETEVSESGSTPVSAPFCHELLARSSLEDREFSRFAPTADLSYFQDSRALVVRQLEVAKPRNLNGVARGHLALLQSLRPRLRPQYGWVDEFGDNAPLSGKSIKETQLKYIFWTNLFGPRFVEKFGRKFLLEAPGWSKEEFQDGSVLYVVKRSFVDWWRNKPQSVLEYFRSQIPDVQLFRARQAR